MAKRKRKCKRPPHIDKLYNPAPDEYVAAKLEWIRNRDHPSKLHVLYERQNGKCFYCFGNMWIFRKRDKRPPGINCANFVATPDHIIPKSKGGNNDIDNLVCACFGCNSSRGSRDLTEQERERLSTLLFDKAA